jgi:hypothetical protein
LQERENIRGKAPSSEFGKRDAAVMNDTAIARRRGHPAACHGPIELASLIGTSPSNFIRASGRSARTKKAGHMTEAAKSPVAEKSACQQGPSTYDGLAGLERLSRQEIDGEARRRAPATVIPARAGIQGRALRPADARFICAAAFAGAASAAIRR